MQPQPNPEKMQFHWRSKELYQKIRQDPQKEIKCKILKDVLKHHNEHYLYNTKDIKDQLTTIDLIWVLGEEDYDDVFEYHQPTAYRILTGLCSLLEEDIKESLNSQENQAARAKFFQDARNMRIISSLPNGEMSHVLMYTKPSQEKTIEYLKSFPLKKLELAVECFNFGLQQNMEQTTENQKQFADLKDSSNQVKNYIIGKYAIDAFSNPTQLEAFKSQVEFIQRELSKLNNSNYTENIKWLLQVINKEVDIKTDNEALVRRFGYAINQANDAFLSLM